MGVEVRFVSRASPVNARSRLSTAPCAVQRESTTHVLGFLSKPGYATRALFHLQPW